jgi:hypothetical protein
MLARRPEHAVAPRRVDAVDDEVERPVEGARRAAVQAPELLRPAHLVGGERPLPGAHARAGEGEAAALVGVAAGLLGSLALADVAQGDEHAAVRGHRVELDPAAVRDPVRATLRRGVAVDRLAQRGPERVVDPARKQRPKALPVERGARVTREQRQRRVGVEDVPAGVDQRQGIGRPVQASGESGLGLGGGQARAL